MFAATFYDGFKNRALLVEENVVFLALGFVSAFITALAVIAVFMRFIQHNTFRPFAYYRIVVGGWLLYLS
jgi:undecaprenyl-diphosphatase